MRTKPVIIVFAVFVLFAGIASAGVLNYFGIIQGTANVEPAVEITNESLPQDSDVDVGVRNNLERKIEDQVDLTRYNETETQETLIKENISFSEDNWEKVINADLSEASEVRVKIDETIVDSVEVDNNE